MSITRKMYATITCDGCKTAFDEHGDGGWTVYDTPTEAVNAARYCGWDCTDGRHLCEDCLPEDDEASLEGPVGLTP